MQQTILIVDDEQLNRQVILDILTSSGNSYKVLSADDGELGCKIAIRMLPDIILMDWNMPKMPGIEAVKRLKSLQETKNIPILMVTSIALPEKLQEAFEAGVVDYIIKPLKKIELLARVDSALKTYTYFKEIIKQKTEIENQKEEITNSIDYAQSIQKAILPKRSAIHHALKDSFVLFNPKDIVSGDFYWYYNSGNKIFLAALDCTGHGVPGAFVSMIGNMLLNQVIIEKKIHTPGKILTQLNNGIKTVFTREDNKLYANDGMDMALICFDKEFKTAEFAGANNPLFLVRENTITAISGDRQPIGGRTDINSAYTTHTVNLQKKDNIYIFSDGYVDQFGGPKGKKFKQNQFRSLLLDIQNKTMKEQKEIMLKKMEDWKGTEEQVDDILVLGIKI
ncbi:MAG: response regulator [Flavobacteriales bacterium]|nr:response regulator [Flavobacteriales bacterium]